MSSEIRQAVDKDNDNYVTNVDLREANIDRSKLCKKPATVQYGVDITTFPDIGFGESKAYAWNCSNGEKSQICYGDKNGNAQPGTPLE